MKIYRTSQMMHNGNVISEIFFMMMLIKHAFQKKKTRAETIPRLTISVRQEEKLE